MSEPPTPPADPQLPEQPVLGEDTGSEPALPGRMPPRVQLSLLDRQFAAGPPPRGSVPEIVALLRRLMDDPDMPLRMQAVRLLARLGRDAAPAAEALAGLVGDSYTALDSAAREALAAIGPPAIGPTTALLRGSDRRRRVRGAWVLAAMGRAAAPAIPELRAALDGADDTLARACVRAIRAAVGASGDPAVIRDLVGHANPHAAAEAATVLGRLGFPGFTELRALTAALARREGDVRRAAAEALGHLLRNTESVFVHGPVAEAVGALQGALRDRDPVVRDEARRVLARLGLPSSGRPG